MTFCAFSLSTGHYARVLGFRQGVVTLKIHRHGGWRKKLFDSELSMPLAASGLSSGVITVAWLDDGRMMARSDFRKGVMGCTT